MVPLRPTQCYSRYKCFSRKTITFVSARITLFCSFLLKNWSYQLILMREGERPFSSWLAGNRKGPKQSRVDVPVVWKCLTCLLLLSREIPGISQRRGTAPHQSLVLFVVFVCPCLLTTASPLLSLLGAGMLFDRKQQSGGETFGLVQEFTVSTSLGEKRWIWTFL